ncbi:MAG: mechanosensitive ion channel family protein [Prolixibacteraceae bacterium]
MKIFRKTIIPSILAFLFILLNPAVNYLFGEPDSFWALILSYNQIPTIIVITWALIQYIKALKNLLLTRYDIQQEDNLKPRKIYTQVNILANIIIFVIILFAIGFVLLSFENIRKIGIGLFASAGVAGIILGLAAQKVLATIIAGIQLAIAQPFRIDDAVVVENEWGWIEEINLTYVVVRIWDKRRLILPSTYFMEKPFQNWTRTTAEIIGSVFIYTDYTIPFEPLRTELTRLLNSTALWDKDVNVLQVTDAKESTLEIRILVSAKNSPTAWDLRVFIREKMIEFIQKNYPESLPKSRLIIKNESKNAPLVEIAR